MTQFNFITLKQTEKAIFAKVPYFEATSDGVKKHKQLFFECWIPKAVIEKGVAKDFVIGKRNEKDCLIHIQDCAKCHIVGKHLGNMLQ
jgi:hypothetical protein